MRLWSLHPKYLDSKGLIALWREALLAKKVLEDKTKGYKNHPQLDRFKKTERPVDSINQYLSIVYLEAERRQYNFNKDKINWDFKATRLSVTMGQIDYEALHLLRKLKTRDMKKYRELKAIKKFDSHPLFKIVEGSVEDWEVIND